MPRRPAVITQADVARAIRAAKAEGAEAVDIKPDGTIHISLVPALAAETTNDEKRLIPL